MRQPFKVEDIPPEAFSRADKLVLALKELSKRKITLNVPSNSTYIFPFEALGIDVPSMKGSFSCYDMDTNRLAADDFEERNKKKARDLLEHMLANPALSRNNSAKRPEQSSRRSTRSRNSNNDNDDSNNNNNDDDDDDSTKPLSFNADKLNGYFEDRSSLYTTSVTSPRKVPDSQSSQNPVNFLQNEPAPIYPLYQESLQAYKTKGYITGNPAYAKAWKDKVDSFHHQYSDPIVLNKLLTTLMKWYPDKIAVEAAYCSLADTRGSINEALGKLASKDYLREIQIVCTMISIDQYLPTRGLLSSSSSSSSLSPTRDRMNLGSPSVSSLPHTAGSTGNDDSTLIRVRGVDAENKLPHFNMLQSSAAVVRRGSVITPVSSSLSPIRDNRPDDNNRSIQTSPINLPPINNTNTNTNTNSLKELSIGFDQSLLDISKSLLTMSVLEAPPPVVMKSSSLSALGDKKVSLKLSNAIDQMMMNNPSPIKIMTKRDAFKAHEDEILYKSNNIKFKKLSSIYKEEARQARANKANDTNTNTNNDAKY